MLRFHRLFLSLVVAICGIATTNGQDNQKNAEADFDIQKLEQQVQSVLDHVRECTVSFGGGSGVIVSKDGYILSCAHVGRSAGRTLTVLFPDGKRVKAKTLGNHKSVDAGMLKIIDEGEYPFAEMAKSSELKPGQWCIAVGYPVSFPRGKRPPVRIGRVLASSSRAITTDVPIMGGESGGPLFDLEGRVIGINSRVGGRMTQNIHVPADQYADNWDRLAKGEDWGQAVGNRNRRQQPQQRRRPQRPDSEEPKKDAPQKDTPKKKDPKSDQDKDPKPQAPKSNDNKSTEGSSIGELGMKVALKDGSLVVVEVKDDSLAERRGVRVGDVIMKIEDRKVKDVSALNAAIKKQDGTFDLTVRRPAAANSVFILPIIRDKK